MPITTGGEPREPKEQSILINAWAKELFAPENIKRHVEQEIAELTESGETDGSINWQTGIIAIDGSKPSSVLGREVERIVLGEFFGNDLDCLMEEYKDYDPYSVFFVALDRQAMTPAGVLRLIKESPVGLKSVNDVALPEYPWHVSPNDLATRMKAPSFLEAKTADIATVAIMPKYRSKDALDGLSAHLYYALYQWSRSNNYEQWVGILDTKPLEKVQLLGEPFEFFDGVEAEEYIDSPSSIPFFANLDRIDQKTKQVGLYDFFVKGQGLDPKIKFNLG